MESLKKIALLIEKQLPLWLIASLSLGLAPFFPEPHIWGKIKWVSGGAVGMKAADWFDLIMHGLPWLLLLIAIIIKLVNRRL